MSVGTLRGIARKEKIPNVRGKTKAQLATDLHAHYQNKFNGPTHPVSVGTVGHTGGDGFTVPKPPKSPKTPEQRAAAAARRAARRQARAEAKESVPSVRGDGIVNGRNLKDHELDAVKMADVPRDQRPPIRGAVPNEQVYLKTILVQQGFDGKPRVVSKREMNDHINNGGVEMFRTVTPAGGRSIKDLHNDFKQGNLYAGHGIWGHGTYAASSANGDSRQGLIEAKTYGNRKDKNNTMRMSLKEGAKHIEYQEAYNEMKKEQSKAQSKGRGAHESEDAYNARMNLYNNVGYWAAAKGYDAIFKPNGNGTAQGKDAHYWVILNRTAVIVQDEAV